MPESDNEEPMPESDNEEQGEFRKTVERNPAYETLEELHQHPDSEPRNTMHPGGTSLKGHRNSSAMRRNSPPSWWAWHRPAWLALWQGARHIVARLPTKTMLPSTTPGDGLPASKTDETRDNIPAAGATAQPSSRDEPLRPSLETGNKETRATADDAGWSTGIDANQGIEEEKESFDEREGSRIDMLPRAPTPEPVLGLMRLPCELILEIMEFLSPPSLYCFRQTSRITMSLFCRRPFRQFHANGSRPGTHCTMFRMTALTLSEQDHVSNMVLRDLCCASCLEAKCRGTVESRLKELGSLRYCDGCKEMHAIALFFPEDVEKHESQGTTLTCIGRQWKVSVCKHSTRSTRWSDIENGQRVRRRRAAQAWICHQDACLNLSHEPEADGLRYRASSGRTSVFPRFVAEECCNMAARFFVGYGWDLPVLDICQTSPPPLRLIRETLSRLVAESTALHNLQRCPHLRLDFQVEDFTHSGICECFRTRRRKDPHGIIGCRCERQEYLECRVCGAVYLWFLERGRVYLSHRNCWYLNKPTSPGWMFLLDQDLRERMRVEANRHVLWCDTPGCPTSRSRRWERLVKQDVRRDYNATAKAVGREPRLSETDLGVMLHVANLPGRIYEMP